MTGLLELGRELSLLKGPDFRASVQRIRQHNIRVWGSFIIGLDADGPGTGKCIADLTGHYGVGNLSYRNNSRLDRKAYADFKRRQGHKDDGACEVQGEPAARRRRPDGRPATDAEELLIR